MAVGAEALIEGASRLASATPGLAFSVALVERSGREHTATVGAPADDRFPSCSAFKPVVAAAVRSAAADGVVDLNAPVRSQPGGTIAPEGRDASLELLLGHLSGLATDFYEVPVTDPSDDVAVTALLDEYLPRTPRTQPGRFWYSNLGYVLAGHVLAVGEGAELLDVVRQRVLEPSGATVATASSAATAITPNDSLRAAGCGTYLAAVDLARVGVALAAGPLRPLGLTTAEPLVTLPVADQHPAGGFFVDARHGRRLLVHGGGYHGFGASWVVDPIEGWSATALFDHPAGYGLDVASMVLGRAADADDLRPSAAPPQPGWYVNEHGGVLHVAPSEIRCNGRPFVGRCSADAYGVLANELPIVIGVRPFDPIDPPDCRPTPSLAGTYRSDLDELEVELGDRPKVTSELRGRSRAVALTPTRLASDLGVVELVDDELVVGGAYRFARA